MLDDLARLGGFFAVGAHPPGAAPVLPWRAGGELLSPSRPLMDRIASVRAALASRAGLAVDAVEPRVAASTVHLGLAARLASPALGAAVLGCPLDLRPGGLWWQEALSGPVALSAPAPDPGGRGGGPGRAPGEWQRVLLDEVLAPATAAIAHLVPVSGRVLRGNLASAVNAAARLVARQRPDLADGAWQAAAGLFASPLLDGERQPPGPAFRRSSCCLYYRAAPGGRADVCGDCVLAARPAPRSSGSMA
jgi:hypothetical protein